MIFVLGMTPKIERNEKVSIELLRLFDMNAKMEMARQIVLLCLAGKYQRQIMNDFIVNIGSRHFPTKILKQLVVSAHTMDIQGTTRTFSSWIKHSMSKRDLYLIEHNDVDKFCRDIIFEQYVKIRTLLPKHKFITKLKNIAYQRALNVQEYMKTRGYKSKRLPHSFESIIIEDPELRFARLKYLISIQQYRKAGAHIVYIDTKVANNSGFFVEKIKLSNDIKQVFLTIFQRAVSPVMGMLSKNTRGMSIVLKVDTSDDLNNFQLEWIIETVIPQISAPSVFVLEENIFCDQTQHGDAPTMYSSKTEMLNWLEVNDIPHTSNMHSAELFELIKKSNRKLIKKKYKLDEILMSYGHKVLRRPRMTNYLNYFDALWEKVTNKSLAEKLNVFNVTTLANWKCMDEALSEIEQNVLKEDIAVNITIEKLLTYVKHERIPCNVTQLLDCNNDIDEFKMEDVVKII